MAESAISVKSQSSHRRPVLKLKLSQPNVCWKLEDSLQEGNVVLFYMDVEQLCQTEHSLSGEELAFISKVLQREFVPIVDSHICTFEARNGPVTVHPEFQLYLITNKSLEDVLLQGSYSIGGYQLVPSDFCVINVALSLEGEQSHLRRLIITHEKPEYRIRYKSLLTDLILHQQKLVDSQVCVFIDV